MVGRFSTLLPAMDPDESSEDAPLRLNSPTLLKGRLGLRHAYSTIICNIIGSGIFSTPGLVFAAAGSPCASILVWGFSGLISTIGALCYAELATGNVNSAAEAAYFENAFHKSLSFSFLVVSFVALSSGSIAIEATVFARYFMTTLNIDFPGAHGIIAVGLIALLAHLNQRGIEQSAEIQQAMVIFKIVALFMIIIALAFTPASDMDGAKFTNLSECFAGTSPGGFGVGMLASLWAYSGYNSVCALSEEFANPKKDLPIGASFGMLTVIVFYILCNFAYLRVIDPVVLATSDSIGYTFAKKVGGETFAIVLSLAIMLATMGAAHSTVFGQARLFYAAGRDGIFNEWFGKVNEEGVPANSTLALSAWSGVLVLLGNNLSVLINYSGLATWLFAGLAGIAVMRLRPRTHSNTFRMWCFPLSPLTFTATCFAVVLSGFVTDLYPTVIIFTLLFTTVIYYVGKYGWKTASDNRI